MTVDPALEAELREALRELIEELGAKAARIVAAPPAAEPSTEPAADGPTGQGEASEIRTRPLGGGDVLRVELGARTGDDIAATLERAARHLRAIRLRSGAPHLPELAVTAAGLPPSDRIAARIEAYVRALGGVDRATNAFVTRGARLVACARPPDEVEAARWPFLARRALASPAPGSSHGEVVDPDAYAMSFWYDATLVVLLAEPYAVDFVRHRCRLVARELANLLPMLDPDPGTPASARRRPPTGP